MLLVVQAANVLVISTLVIMLWEETQAQAIKIFTPLCGRQACLVAVNI
jgi:hypothetical protein